jgi:hypothetical protein
MHTPAIRITMTKMFAKNGLIDPADYCRAISLFPGKPGWIFEKLTFKIPLLIILNTPSCIKVAKGSAVNYCTCRGNDSYKG